MFTFQKNKNLYLVIGSTVVFILYIIFFLRDISSCFFIEDGNRSLGLSFYYTQEMVQNFFEIRNQEQLLISRKKKTIYKINKTVEPIAK